MTHTTHLALRQPPGEPPTAVGVGHACTGQAADLPIQVIELHIHDYDVCANCRSSLALGGQCFCGDRQLERHLFVIAYRDVRATISSNLSAHRQSLHHRLAPCSRPDRVPSGSGTGRRLPADDASRDPARSTTERSAG